MNVQLRRRLDISTRRAFSIRLLGGLVALIFTGLILWIAGEDPVSIGDISFRSTFRSQIGFEDTLLIATPIMMAAVAVAIGFRARVWNIGVAGQFLDKSQYLVRVPFPPQRLEPLLVKSFLLGQ